MQAILEYSALKNYIKFKLYQIKSRNTTETQTHINQVN